MIRIRRRYEALAASTWLWVSLVQAQSALAPSAATVPPQSPAVAPAPAVAAPAAPPPAPGLPPAIYEGKSPYVLAPRTALVIAVPDVADGFGLLNLRNPANDARAITAALRKAGFQVTNVLDEVGSGQAMTRTNITKAIYDFSQVLQSVQGVGLIYFSGHGLQNHGKEYLYPYDGFVRFDRDLDEELIPAALLIDAFREAKTSLNFLIIDACRDELDTADLKSFGERYSAPSSVSPSEDVVTAYSALSGTEALDGTGVLSPFAQAFVDAVKKPDLTLAEFFGSIQRELWRTRGAGTIKDVLSVPALPGRDFVFVPTEASFYREKEIYDELRVSGEVSQLEELIWTMPGGYFAAATSAWLESQPKFVRPPPEAPTILLQTVAQSNIRAAPNLNAGVVGTARRGEALAAVGAPVENNGAHWFPIVGATVPGRVDYIRNDRARVVAHIGSPISVGLDFVTGPQPGTKRLSDAALRALREALGSPTVMYGGVVNVIGYTSSLDEHQRPVTSIALLVREAAALSALRSFGVESSRINVLVRARQTAGTVDSVVVTIDQVE